MATNKTIQPTNVTVQIPAMADKPNQATNSNCLDKIIDGVNALNSKVSNKVLVSDDGFVSSAIDLNDITDSITIAWSGTNKSLVSNKPFDDAGSMIAFKMGPDNNRRIVMFVAGTSNLYFRWGYGNNWGSWYKLNN